ncbi:hypothetical protein EVAR_16973_1 [Eumeta japonica]|uniref:Uncharacterized protein n=1 Tax=Eumeta variegata TaxID=151549 RepID=A0A4C1TVJ2_EUMVA|nr:hypothetical protein EVAR_16973_1 [Eumeta japonica]
MRCRSSAVQLAEGRNEELAIQAPSSFEHELCKNKIVIPKQRDQKTLHPRSTMALFCDESWIYAYDPETKQQSMVCVFQDEPSPTKVLRAKSTEANGCLFFWHNRPYRPAAARQRQTELVPEPILDLGRICYLMFYFYLWVVSRFVCRHVLFAPPLRHKPLRTCNLKSRGVGGVISVNIGDDQCSQFGSEMDLVGTRGGGAGGRRAGHTNCGGSSTPARADCAAALQSVLHPV